MTATKEMEDQILVLTTLVEVRILIALMAIASLLTSLQFLPMTKLQQTKSSILPPRCLVELENGVGLVIEWCEWVYSFFWFVFSPSV
jgi:hypothetical protein